MEGMVLKLPRRRACLDQIKPYVPGKPIDEVKRELGLDDVIKLASNENPLGPSPQALEALSGVLPKIKSVSYTHLDVYKRQVLITLLLYSPKGGRNNLGRFPVSLQIISSTFFISSLI